MKRKMRGMNRKMRAAALALAAALTLAGCGAGGSSGSTVPTKSTPESTKSEAASGTDSSKAPEISGTTDSSATESGTETKTSPARGLADNLSALLAVTPSADRQMSKLVYEGSTSVLEDKYRTTYEIFPYSFRDSNGDGIGDLQGIKEALDYLNDGKEETTTDLGVNELWLTPVHPSPTYHKYDVKDYQDIDPAFGTMEDFDELLAACHQRGIRLIMDLVLNHTSVEHPWFVNAATYLASLEDDEEPDPAECPYLEYYHFTRTREEGSAELDLSKYASGNNSKGKWFYEARFWEGMPDLNLDSEAVRKEITDISKYWLEKGVDGFRLDAVLFYYTNSNDQNIKFLTWFNDMVKGINPDAYIVGECWTGKSTYAQYYASGIDSLFDFAFAAGDGAIAKFINGGYTADVVVDTLAAEGAQFGEYGEAYIDAPFFTNHDTARGAGFFANDDGSKVKMAQAMNLLMTGNAFLYYGEELGMRGAGRDENKRAPMYWSDEKAECMCKGPADMEAFDMIYPSLEEQTADENSILNFIRALIRVRNTYPVIARGAVTKASGICEGKVAAFVKSMEASNAKKVDELGGICDVTGRTDREELRKATLEALDKAADVLIVMNFNGEAKDVELAKSAEAEGFRTLGAVLLASDGEVVLEGDTLKFPAYSAAILQK